METRGGRTYLYRERQRFPSSHGSQPGGHVYFGGQGNAEAGSYQRNTRSPGPIRSWRHRPRQRAMPGFGGILRKLIHRRDRRGRREDRPLLYVILGGDVFLGDLGALSGEMVFQKSELV